MGKRVWWLCLLSLVIGGQVEVIVRGVTTLAKECEYPLEVAYHPPSGMDPVQYSRDIGMEYIRPIDGIGGYHLMRAGCADTQREQEQLIEEMKRTTEARNMRHEMRSPGQWDRGGVDNAEGPVEMVQVPRRMVVRGKRDDWGTYMGAPGRWPIWSTGPMATWVNTTWRAGASGNAVRLVIVDDGLDHTHPDLAPRYDASVSRNFNTYSGYGMFDPRPTTGNTHGTGCGGVAAGYGANGPPPNMPTCNHGVAFGASIGGIRLISDAVTDVTEGEAMGYRCDRVAVKSCSWGPPDDGIRLGTIGPLSAAGFDHCATLGYNGNGTVIVSACGNGAPRDNCAYDAFVQLPRVIAVGAVASNGKASYYSEACPAVFISAPSSGTGTGIVTDLPVSMSAVPHCRSDFGGTSAATPFVAGVVALIRERHPHYSRDAIEMILAVSARRIDHAHPTWTQNGAGYWYSTQYGFGLVNADQALQYADAPPPMTNARVEVIVVAPVHTMRWYTSTTTENPPMDTAISRHSISIINRVSSQAFPIIIPNVRNKAAIAWVDIQDTTSIVNRIKVTISLTHGRRSQLTFALVSPSGTRFIIERRLSDRGANLDSWDFMFVGFLGERAFGTWSFITLDAVPNDSYSGSISNLRLTIYGRHNLPIS